MARVFLSTIDKDEAADPSRFGEHVHGEVTSRAVFAGAKQPLHMRTHDLAAGAAIGWEAGPVGHLVYIWSGTVEAAGLTLDQGSILIVEHHAATQVTAAAGGARVLVFDRALGGDHEAGEAGGHVHALPADRVPYLAAFSPDGRAGGSLYADAACPTCTLWLHGNRFCPGFEVDAHFHSEDEIIVVTEGSALIGGRRYGVGTALQVARNAVYSFFAGPDGLAFINFRTDRPTHQRPGSSHILDEQKVYRERLGPLRPIELTAAA